MFDTGGRAATTTFVEREIGDVLITFETETTGIRKEFGADKFDTVVPLGQSAGRFSGRRRRQGGREARLQGDRDRLSELPLFAGRPTILAENGNRVRDKAVAEEKFAASIQAGASGYRGRGLRRLVGHQQDLFRLRRPARSAARRAVSSVNLAVGGVGALSRRRPSKANGKKQGRVVPGFRLSLGITLFYAMLIICLPLATLILVGARLGPANYWAVVSSPRALASYRVTLGAAALATILNTFYGFALAWVLVRYEFPGRRMLDAMVDLPFALPTSVAGIALTTLYAPNGWLGAPLLNARHQGRLHAARHRRRPGLHRPALRRAHLGAGDAGSRPRD